MKSMTIHPYFDPDYGWVFDDAEKELAKEGLVAGIDVILDKVCSTYGLNPLDGFDVLFSDTEITDADVILEKVLEINGQPEVFGTDYIDQQTEIRGWLCPNLLKYFSNPPEKIYCRVVL
jgi:hypothetical protein